MRRHMITGLLLVPMGVFLILTLVAPIALMVIKSVQDTDVPLAMPLTLEALTGWRATEPVPDAAFEALIRDFSDASISQWGGPANRLNVEMPGARSMVLSAQRALSATAAVDARQALIDHDPRWAEPNIWQAMLNAKGPWTDRFLLAAFDLKRNESQSIESDSNTIYKTIYLRTFIISISVTMICVAVGIPIATYLASLPYDRALPLLLLLMLPLWTSVLVRAMAWILILQNNGPINQALLMAGAIEAPLQLIFNRTGVLVAMTHVLLPFMILPIYNVMRAIPRNQLRAAGSLGATPWTVFRRVYLPQCRSGIAAGCLLVLASGSGYYITPALVGGGSDQMLGTFVELAALRFSNQSLAAALGIGFLAIFVLVIGALFAFLRPTGTRTGGAGA